ncbi:MAG: hypothetical protein U1E23_04085 [Reyranellaceae bacterium]
MSTAQLIGIKVAPGIEAHPVGMNSFTYRCPSTGYQVEGHEVADIVPTTRPLKTYVAERCPACTGLHIVNPETGILLAQEAAAFTRPFAAGGQRRARVGGSWAAGPTCGP